MTTWLFFSLLGVGTGAMYAALAIGLILVYRGSGVVNFAVGAMAMLPALIYAELRSTGELVIPVVAIPRRIDLGDPLGFVPAALIATLVGLAFSLAAYWLVFRPLRTAPAVTALVATVGVTIVWQGLAIVNFGDGNRRTPAILPDDVVTLLGRPFPIDRVWIVVVVVVIGIATSVLYHRSRFGLATRAAFLNEKGAMLIGLDANRLSLVNWVLASVLVSSVGILGSSLGGVNPFNYTLYVVPALGAVLAARLVSFGVAIVAGIAIGMFEALAVHLVAQRHVPDFLLGGFSSLVPFVVIVGVLVVRGQTLPDRSTILDPTRVPVPRARPGWRWLVVVVPAIGFAAFADSPTRFALAQSVFVTTLLLSIVIVTGFVGQVSMAQLSFAGFAALMLSRFDNLPFPIAPLAAIAVTVVVGTLISVPALRVRGILFAIVSYSAAVVLDEVLYRSPTFVGRGGLATVESPSVAGLDLGVYAGGSFPSRRFIVIAICCAVACALLVAAIRNSGLGRRMLAVRTNERAAAAAGIDVPRTKIAAAALASLVAAVAGVMFAYRSVDFTGSGLTAQDGLEILALAYVGGIGSIGGAVIGGLLAPSALGIHVVAGSGTSTAQFLLTGVALIVVTVVSPSGLAGIRPVVAGWLQRLDDAGMGRRPERPPSVDGDVIEIEIYSAGPAGDAAWRPGPTSDISRD